MDHPCLPTALPHIVVHGQTIVRNAPGALRHAATTPDYHTYLKAKYELSDAAIDGINWQMVKLSIRQLTLADQTRIQKFIHDWLPLKGASHTASATNSNLCPHCKREPETIWHFLECQQPSRTARFLQLQAAITQLHLKHRIDPHLTQLYWQGLQTIRRDEPIDDQLEHYPETYRHLFLAQSDIGWDQLYYGRISVQWARLVTINSNYTTNGDQFYATATGIVWQYILDCWTQRNQALHDPQEVPPDARVLADQVHQILEMAQANPELATLLPPQPEATILQKPIRLLRQWAQRGKTHLDNFRNAAHQRAILHTQDIRTFFRPRQANDLRPP